MFNIDNRSDMDSLMLHCEDCGMKRSMTTAFSPNAFSNHQCGGHHPHLGDDYSSDCNETMTARLRSSSSVYFPATASALTIPPWSRLAVRLIQTEFDYLITLDNYGEDAVADYIKRKLLPKATRPLSLSDMMSAYHLVKEKQGSAELQSEADVFAAEYDVLCRGTVSDEEYVATEAKVPAGFERIIEAVNVIDKLTVVSALVGFTRVSPWDGSIEDNPALAPLSRTRKQWYPACKMLGEGIFIKFSQAALDEWEKRVGDRYSDMAAMLDESFFTNERFSPRYVVLHTFAHLLIRQLSEECGYNASSITERIYSTYIDDSRDMYGVLIYLATSDSEGSLGGLISIANDSSRLRAILLNMLHKARWCSADPLCSSSKKQGFNSLNYAACHDCVLLPETSCEFRNVLLDRASIVGTPDEPKLGLFAAIEQDFE